MSGYTDVSLPNEPVLLWTYKTDSRTSSSPVVSNGVTYWSDKRGFIRGVNFNGEQVFDYDFQTAIEATPMIYDSVMYIGRIDGIMTAISLSQKDTLWNFETMGQLSASANCAYINNKQTVVFGSYDYYLYCLDIASGKEINRFESGYYINGAVAVQERYVLFGGCDAWLRVIDCQSGIASDSLLLDEYIPASPAIMDNYCYIGDYSGNIYELQLEKGKIVAHKKIAQAAADDAAFVSVPAVTAESLFFLTDDQNLHSISRKDGKVNWKYLMKGKSGESSPVVCKDKIIVCSKNGFVYILDANSGNLVWEYDAGEQIIASPAVIKNRFYILTAKGTLFCFGDNKVQI